MAYGSVQIPAGCTVSVGDTVGALTDMGVLKGDANIEITYDLVEVKGSKAEVLVSYAKNMKASATFELYQLYLDNIQLLLDGLATVTPAAGTIVNNHQQTIASGDWEWLKFIPFDEQNGAGTVPNIDSITLSTDGVIVANTDYFVMCNEQGVWGFYIIDSATVTTEAQAIVAQFDYTPNASHTMKMGAASAAIVSKIVQFSKTIATKVFRVRLWSARNEAGLTLAFPDSAGDEPASTAVTMTGGLDTTKSSGEQLVEIYDEIGLSMS